MTTIVHRGIIIATLAAGQDVRAHCSAGQIAIRQEADGWWIYFIDSDGVIDGYDSAFASHEEALWTAKAAAEYNQES